LRDYLSNLSDAELASEVRQLIKITYVGHSMGGMTLPMYVINSKVRGKPHHLSKAILISPAGFHSHGKVTPYIHYIGEVLCNLLPLFFDHIALPDQMIGLISKLQ
jgi:pimeloyl-ACP methyl ester carboxylesterase